MTMAKLGTSMYMSFLFEKEYVHYFSKNNKLCYPSNRVLNFLLVGESMGWEICLSGVAVLQNNELCPLALSVMKQIW